MHQYTVKLGCSFNVHGEVRISAESAASAVELAIKEAKDKTYVSFVGQPEDGKYTVHVRCYAFYYRDSYGRGSSGHTWRIRGVEAHNSEDAGIKALRAILKGYYIKSVEPIRTHLDNLKDSGFHDIIEKIFGGK